MSSSASRSTTKLQRSSFPRGQAPACPLFCPWPLVPLLRRRGQPPAGLRSLRSLRPLPPFPAWSATTCLRRAPSPFPNPGVDTPARGRPPTPPRELAAAGDARPLAKARPALALASCAGRSLMLLSVSVSTISPNKRTGTGPGRPWKAYYRALVWRKTVWLTLLRLPSLFLMTVRSNMAIFALTLHRCMEGKNTRETGGRAAVVPICVLVAGKKMNTARISASGVPVLT